MGTHVQNEFFIHLYVLPTLKNVSSMKYLSTYLQFSDITLISCLFYSQTSVPAGAAAAPCVPTEAKRETEEILNAILPPKEWEEEGQIWTQKVCSDRDNSAGNIFFLGR